jgi:hypothetical protein
MGVQVSLLYYDLHSFEYIPRSCMAKSYGTSIFNFLRSLQTAFHSGYTNYSVIKKNEILSFAGKWMELENIILSEVSQIQKVRGHMFSLMCGK